MIFFFFLHDNYPRSTAGTPKGYSEQIIKWGEKEVLFFNNFSYFFFLFFASPNITLKPEMGSATPYRLTSIIIPSFFLTHTSLSIILSNF